MADRDCNQQAVIGVDLGGTKVQAGLVKGQKPMRVETTRISADREAEVIIDEIIDVIEPLLDRSIVGIGIGVPSLVDIDQGIVYSVENIPSWKEVRLKDILENRFQVPVVVNNDANCFALGELYFGTGQGVRHMIGMTIGTGLGAGVIVDGKLYSGRNCGAGEIGCIPYRDKTIEAFCSGQFFQREACLDGGVVYQKAMAGDEAAIELYNRFGFELGMAVMTVVYAFDPELIVMGGSVAIAFRFYERSMRMRLQQFAYPHALKRLRITCCNRADMAVLGAAALVYDAFGSKGAGAMEGMKG